MVFPPCVSAEMFTTIVVLSVPPGRRLVIGAEYVDFAQPVRRFCRTRILPGIEIARRQEAKSFELRAIVSLCRLWQAQGSYVEARQRRGEIYGWFTEGFETADLKKALLSAFQ